MEWRCRKKRPISSQGKAKASATSIQLARPKVSPKTRPATSPGIIPPLRPRIRPANGKSLSSAPKNIPKRSEKRSPTVNAIPAPTIGTPEQRKSSAMIVPPTTNISEFSLRDSLPRSLMLGRCLMARGRSMKVAVQVGQIRRASHRLIGGKFKAIVLVKVPAMVILLTISPKLWVAKLTMRRTTAWMKITTALIRSTL